MHTKKVAICGIGNSLKDLPDEIEVWSLNNNYSRFKKWDLWFDMHRDDLEKKHITQGNFPLTDAVKLRGKQFYSSISYMIAFAVLKKYTHIELYGVDFSCGEEIRTNQRECCLRWVDFARSKNIEVVFAKSSALNNKSPDYTKELDDFLYGYERGTI